MLAITWSGRLWFTTLLLAGSWITVHATPALRLSLSGPEYVDSVDSFRIVATLQNVGNENLKLYNEPRGLLNPVPTDSFRVAKVNGNGRASFSGIVAKYSFSLATNFTTLNVGESVDISHELSQAYTFPSPGAYSVTPANTQFYYQDSTGSPVLITAEVVKIHTAKLTGSLKSRHFERRNAQPRSIQKRGTTVQNCDAALKDQVVLSVQMASLYIADSEKYLTRVPGASPRYTTWFGEFDQSRHDLVLSHFATIRKSDVKTYTFDCACDPDKANLFAYVYPDQFGHVYLCGQYVAANLTGSDSKTGTVVHESTHFTINGGTQDLAYGRGKAEKLAQTNATAAVSNADNHEFFSENTPGLM